MGSGADGAEGVGGDGPMRGGEQMDRGSGTVLVWGVALVVLTMLVAVLVLLQSGVAAGRAATAADLAALAGADAARGLRSGDPCAVAGEVAARNGASVTGCTVETGEQTLQVETAVPVPLLPWTAAGRARAGPPP